MKHIKLFFVALLASVALAGCSWNSAQAPTPPAAPAVVRIGHNAIPQTIFVAQEKGFFKEAGLDVQLQKFSNSNVILEALAHNDIDGAGSIAYSTLFAFENKQPGLFSITEGMTEVADNGWSSLIVKKGSNIKEVKDLKGKKILMRTGLSSKSQTELVLKTYGVDPSDVEFVQVDAAVLVQTFAKDEISAFLDVQPFATMILDKGLGEVLIKSPRTKVLNPYPLAAAPMRKDFIQNNPEVAKKYITALEKAMDFIKNNETEARAIFQKYLELEKSVADAMQLPVFESENAINKDGVNKLADIEMNLKVIDKKPDLAGWWIE